MQMSDTLLITQRGSQEIRDRLGDLDSKAKSILLALSAAPRTIGELLGNLPVERAEALIRIDSLLKDGLVSSRGVASRSQAQPGQTERGAGPGGGLELKDGIFMSEARFLLTDFCVDVFGADSEKLTMAVESANGATGLGRCLREIAALVGQKHPDALPTLSRIVVAINETAE
ncbi:MAG: hypothetical protein WBP72_17925 [Rhodocyclaceae bacterium]